MDIGNDSFTFDVVNNSAKVTTQMNADMAKKIVSFYLLKVDDWQGDRLRVYLNDLIVD